MSFTISTLYGPMMRPVKVYVLALLSLSLLSCSQTSPKLSTRFLVSSKTVTSPDGQAPPMPPELVPQSGSLSQATTTDIADFGMYIREIKVCQSINILGESFSDPQGCIIFLKRPDISGLSFDPSNEWSEISDQGRLNSPSLTNLMEKAKRVAVTSVTELNSTGIGEYRFGIISWYPVARVQASMLMGSTNYFTLNGTTAFTNGIYLSTADGTFTAGPAARPAYLPLKRYEQYFVFLTPFSLTKDLLSNSEDLRLDLIFSPETTLQAYSSSLSCPECSLVDTAGNHFRLTIPTFSPVIRRESTGVKKESYLANINATDIFDLRLDLFMTTSDTANLFSASGHTLVQVNSATTPPLFPSIVRTTIEKDGSYTFYNAEGEKLISAFNRVQKKGERTGAILHCPQSGSSFKFAGCSTTIDINLTLYDNDQLLDD